MTSDYIIRELRLSDIEETLNTASKVFNEFVAPDYSEIAIQEFNRFISPDHIEKKILDGSFRGFVCIHDDKIIGVSMMKLPNHINMLFVDSQHHQKGIARSMMNIISEHCKQAQCVEITVNSSPYAVGIYHKLGFKSVGSEQNNNGFKFTQMKQIL